MKVIGWVGIALLIVSVILSSIATAIIADPKRDNNTWHHVAAWGGVMLAIIGIVLIIIGGRTPSVPKGFKQIVVSEVYAKNIMEDMKAYEKGGPLPCFARAPTTMYGRFKKAFGMGGVPAGAMGTSAGTGSA